MHHSLTMFCISRVCANYKFFYKGFMLVCTVVLIAQILYVQWYKCKRHCTLLESLPTYLIYCFTTGNRCLKMKQKLRNYLKLSKREKRKRRNIKVRTVCVMYMFVFTCVLVSSKLHVNSVTVSPSVESIVQLNTIAEQQAKELTTYKVLFTVYTYMRTHTLALTHRHTHMLTHRHTHMLTHRHTYTFIHTLTNTLTNTLTKNISYISCFHRLSVRH